MAEKKSETWSLEPHVCRGCGGRIVRRATGPSAVTPGGNPIYACADCGIRGSGFGPSFICWCGMAMRGGNAGAYRCVALRGADPHVVQAARNCGCDPERTEIGIALESDLQRDKEPRRG